MSSSHAPTWVSDRLHDVFGYSADALADFVVALSSKAQSEDALVESLVSSGGMERNAKLTQFAKELMQRIPKQQTKKKESSALAAHRQAVQEARKAQSYALIDDDDVAMQPAPSAPSKKSKAERAEAKSLKKEKKREKRMRRAARSSSESSSDSSDDEAERRSARASSASVAATSTSAAAASSSHPSESDIAAAAAAAASAPLTAEEEAELAREQDQAEKKLFEQRLLQREAERTKKYGQGKGSASQMSEAELREMLPAVREKARQVYLAKREAQQLELLKRRLADEEFLFANARLSAEERRQLRKRKAALDLTTARKKLSEDVQAYHMPDSHLNEEGKIDKSKKMAVLTKRYVEESKHQTEQEQWEAEQTKAALMKFGAGAKPLGQNATAAAAAMATDVAQIGGASQQYDYVFEEDEAGIEFVKQELMAGMDKVGREEAEEEMKVEMEEAKPLSEYEQIQEQRRKLPIYPYKDELIDAIDKYQVLIVVAETGSGKTTQLTQYLVEAGYAKKGRIGCTQPRRVAAMSVAARVAQEMNVKLGQEVGYTIRFEDCSSERTIVKYLTDGMLLREFLGEPDLKSYSCLIIDEAHERTLHTDILFGLIKDIARYRPDIKILISSATLDAEKFSNYFDEAPVFEVPGRRYPVSIYYTKAPEADYLDACIVTVMQIHSTQPEGDILVFLTGQEEIETCEQLLNERMKGMGKKLGELLVLPIYSTLPTEMQARIFAPTPKGARKVVLATNIAETSLTINGIIYVIDPGFSKQKSYNPRTGMESLIVTPISRASARQRSGRAGRVAPGKCFRLYTAHAFAHELEENSVPEIQRTNLCNVVLMLKSLGINDLIHFDFMDPPPAETLIRALEQLYALGALNDRGELTKLGRRMAELPLDPQLSKTLLAAEKYDCVEDVLTICSMLSVNNTIFYRPKDKLVHADTAHRNLWHPTGDHLTLLNVYRQWRDAEYSADWCFENFFQLRSLKRCRDIRDQLVNMLSRVEIELDETSEEQRATDDVAIRKSFTAGFFYHVARLDKTGCYKTIKHSQQVHMHPSSCLAQELPRWLLYHELVLTNKAFMRQVIEIDPGWLVECAPHYYSKKEVEDQSKIKMPKQK